MARHIIITSLCVLAIFALTLSCRHKPFVGPGTGNGNGTGVGEAGCYPEAVANIIVTKCATSGCHNAATHSGGFTMDTWEHLFDGGNNGACVVPYSPKYSSLLYFINQDTTNLDPINPDPDTRMPLKPAAPLSAAEYKTIRDWISAGAPNCKGVVPFSTNPDTRQKIYMSQQGCDLVAVIDAEKKVVMRYIKVGVQEAIESPHCLRTSNDGKYAYVCFIGGTHLQRINTSTDQIDNSVLIPSVNSQPRWNILYITPDDKNVLVNDYSQNGGSVMLDAITMSPTAKKYYSPMVNPHGLAASANFDTMYISSQYGNTIYKIATNNTNVDLAQKISLDGNPTVQNLGPVAGMPDPHEVVMVPDGSKYVVTCQNTNQVKIVDAHTNVVLKTFTIADGVGMYPQEVAFSRTNKYAYISCQDNNGTGIFKGSVFIFNYETLTATGSISALDGQFNRPHGLTVDDRTNTLYVASVNTDGPAPHHISECGYPNGYYRIFSSLPPFAEINSRKYEVSVAPYSVDVRFKN
jgi:DNA-binding beta-propeller fold protein YncE